jgi:hypothetical protein
VKSRPSTKRELSQAISPGVWVGVDRSDVRRDLVAPRAAARDRVEAVRDAARRQIQEAEEELTRAVTKTWLFGASWQAIGTILGISRQAAAQRFGAAAREALRRRELDQENG